MKKITVILFTILSANNSMASPELARSKNCMACHSIDNKLVGPGFKEIANRYNGKNIEEKLTKKVLTGGSGTWGAVPMPSNNQINEAEAKTLVRWILSLK
jgi:cytochrome c